MNFPNVLPNLIIAFSVVFNLVSKLASSPVAATHIAGAEFILTIPDGEEITIVVIVERDKSDKNIIVRCGCINRCLTTHWRKMTDITSLISCNISHKL